MNQNFSEYPLLSEIIIEKVSDSLFCEDDGHQTRSGLSNSHLTGFPLQTSFVKIRGNFFNYGYLHQMLTDSMEMNILMAADLNIISCNLFCSILFPAY
jgi:hypothetical protein